MKDIPLARGVVDKQALSDIDQVQYNGHLLFLSDFGIWSLTIQEAAELISADMWFSGKIDGIEEPEDFDGDPCDPRLKNALHEITQAFAARLMAAVDLGKLDVELAARDFDEKLDPSRTFINFGSLDEWLRERGYEYGDMLDEWHEAQTRIAQQICDEVAYLKVAARQGRMIANSISLQGYFARAGRVDEMDADALRAAVKDLVSENQALKDRISETHEVAPRSKADRPMTTRSRRTLLTLIAALCDYAGIDHQSRGAAQRIRETTEGIGVPVDDGTISKALSEIPDALESRMK